MPSSFFFCTWTWTGVVSSTWIWTGDLQRINEACSWSTETSSLQKYVCKKCNLMSSITLRFIFHLRDMSYIISNLFLICYAMNWNTVKKFTRTLPQKLYWQVNVNKFATCHTVSQWVYNASEYIMDKLLTVIFTLKTQHIFLSKD